MTELVDVILGGTFHAAVLFLVAAGLQLVFGVQKIVNLACGSFYALGAYFGITAVGMAIKLGMPPALFLPVLILAGLAIGLVGLPIERVLRTIYRRDESYQLLITFGFLLMFQDVFRFVWGATPRTMDNVYLAYGTANFWGVRVPTYNLLVIASSIAIAVGLGLFLERTKVGRIVRATAENRDMAEGLGVSAIAGRLYLSESTAKSHIGRIYEKLGAANRAQALVTAMRTGLISSVTPPS